MPIYIIIYLALFFLFAFATSYMHSEEGKPIAYLIPEVVCYVFMICFVLIFYNQQKVLIDKFFIATMFLFSMGWQFFSFIEDAKTAKYRFGIKGKELLFYTVLTGSFISPCFIFAILLLI